MSESKHTPGPWYEADDRIRDAASDAIVATIEDGGHVELELFTSADRKKHARLIAAAPDLLEALKMLRDADLVAVTDGYSGTMGVEQRSVVDAAIAKAEGRS